MKTKKLNVIKSIQSEKDVAQDYFLKNLLKNIICSPS